MEKCDICGKETPIMQLGVRYCTKCGDSIIRVCQPCGVHPFYCTKCKPKKGWCEDKDPDCIGKDGKPKARRHRDARFRAQVCKANNNQMVKQTQVLKRWVLYHGTGEKEAEIILREGLKPNKTAMFRAVYLTPDIKKAEEFAVTKRGYRNSQDILPREGVVLEVVITEEDFNKQLRRGTSNEIVELRRKNLDKTIAENWFEYEWYTDIPANQIKIISTKKAQLQDELYHVTFKTKSNKLLREGILPKRTHNYRGRFGRKLKDLGTIYAFTDFDDAVRWASKMQFDFKKPTIIVAFRDNASEWEQDTHWESAGAKGKWLKKKGAVLPQHIIEIVPLTLEMTRAVVQTGFKDKELTRLHGVVEMK